jgi:hypothetical protein
MTQRVGYTTVLLVLLATVPAFSDDQQKAEKQVNKLTAMATDATGRRIVSMTIADALGVPRGQLVRERRAMNLNYGSVFVAHKLTASGVKMLDIALELQAGKTIFQIGGERHANWKQIAVDARKLNSKIDDNLYAHFVNGTHDDQRDQADDYHVAQDGVKSDNKVSDLEIEDAQYRYVRWRDRAGEGSGRDGRLSPADERAAYIDHARSAGPQAQGVQGGAAPAAGGLPTR